MKPLSIEIENFMGFGEASFDLKDRGVVLVIGDNKDSESNKSNGSGKSTLVVEAPLWCWFGRTTRGLSGRDVVWQVGDLTQAEASVKCKYIDSAGKKCCIERYQTTKGQKLKFLVEDNDVTQKDLRRTQELIDQSLGFDFDFAVQSMILGQGSLVFASSNDTEKKKIFEKILGLDKFVPCLERAKDLVKETEGGIQKLSIEIESLKSKKSDLEHSISEYKEKHEEYEKSW